MKILSEREHQIWSFLFIYLFFLSGFSSHKHSWSTEQQWRREVLSLTALYHFHPLYRHLDINLTITAEISPPHIASSRITKLRLFKYARMLSFQQEMILLEESLI